MAVAAVSVVMAVTAMKAVVGKGSEGGFGIMAGSVLISRKSGWVVGG